MDSEDEEYLEKELLGVNRRGLHRASIIAVTAGILGLFWAGTQTIVEDYTNPEEISRRGKVKSVLESRTRSIPTKVIEGDTLQIYAVEVLEKNKNCLEGINAGEIEDYIGKINPGVKDSKLIPGMQILLPSYNVETCKRLSDSYPAQK